MDASVPPALHPDLRVLAVIPARWGSTRFPGKPLADIAGKPLVQHVWERCRESRSLDRIVVATDDARIEAAAREFGAEVCRTREDHPSGTDRAAEVAEAEPGFGIILNVQGDEPLIAPELIDELAEALRRDPEVAMVTAANPMEAGEAWSDPNVVKVVTDEHGRALYFSRSPIPYRRDAEVPGLVLLRHKGIYGYRRAFLLQFVGWEPSVLERCEGLEQLRALEHGATIRVVVTDDASPGVDTPEQASIVARQIRGL